MAPKKVTPAGVSPSASKATHGVSTASSGSSRHVSNPSNTSASITATLSGSPSAKTTSAPALRSAQDLPAIVSGLWENYVASTPQRTKLLDAFMLFLVVVGAVQFVYCVIGGNFPFNAFLSGFSATVGQFVLTASLRMQTAASNAVEFKGISHERMILHFFCVNFIN